MGEEDAIRRCAVVLLAMGPENADAVLRRLDADAVKAITRQLAQAQDASAEEIEDALGRFLAVAAHKPEPFEDLGDADSAALLESIVDESAQTIALVLSHLPPDKAGGLLEQL